MMQLSLDPRPHPSTIPPRVFPPPIPWPEHLTIRHKPWKSQLLTLDKKNPHLPRDDWDRDIDEPGYKNYLYSRIPYCQLASERLQAAVSLRNDYEFVLPKIVNGTPETPPSRVVSGPVMMPTLRRVLDSEVNTSSTSRKRAKTASPRQPHLSDSCATPGLDKETFEDGSTRIPELEGFDVDKETGRGLRDYMLNMGKKHGMRKVACDSFSFFDFTPNMRDGVPKMRLLKHLIKGEGYRTDVYEIDIPTTFTNDDTGEKHTANVTWLWFYISHDLIDTPYNGIPPPNSFPNPNPTSWIAFALPLSYANKYETVIEYLPEPPGTPNTIPVPSHPQHPRLNMYTTTLPKRTDYDLSFSGTPIFEFSPKPPQAMAGWQHYLYERNAFQHPASYELAYDPFVYGMQGRFLNVGYVAPMGGPGLGDDEWWDLFYRGVYGDMWAWEGVRGAMGRGCLRLVVRWCEVKGGGDLLPKPLVERGVGLGIARLDQELEDDHHHEDENLDFEKRRGFGDSRGEVLGKRGRTASVPPPLNLGSEWGCDRLISRGEDSLSLSDYDDENYMGGTQSVSSQDSYHTSQEEKEMMEFHFGISQNDGTTDFGRHIQRPSIFESWPRRLNHNKFAGFRNVEDDNKLETRLCEDSLSISPRYFDSIKENHQNKLQVFGNTEGQEESYGNENVLSTDQCQDSLAFSSPFIRSLGFRDMDEDKNKENQNTPPNHPSKRHYLVPPGFNVFINENRLSGLRGIEEEEENQDTFFTRDYRNTNMPQSDLKSFYQNPNTPSIHPTGSNTPTQNQTWQRGFNKSGFSSIGNIYNGEEDEDNQNKDQDQNTPAPPRNQAQNYQNTNTNTNTQSYPTHAVARFLNSVSANATQEMNSLITSSPENQNIYPYKTCSLYASPNTPKPDRKLLHFAHIMEMGNGPVGYIGSPWLGGDAAPGEAVEDVLVVSTSGDGECQYGGSEMGGDGSDQPDQTVSINNENSPSHPLSTQKPIRLALSHLQPDGSPRLTNEQLQELEKRGYKYRLFKSSPSIEPPPFKEEDSDDDENPDIGIKRRLGRVVHGADGAQFTNSSFASESTVREGEDGRGYRVGKWSEATGGSEMGSLGTGCTVLLSGGEGEGEDELEYGEGAGSSGASAQSVMMRGSGETESAVLDPRLWYLPTDIDGGFDVETGVGGTSEGEGLNFPSASISYHEPSSDAETVVESRWVEEPYVQQRELESDEETIADPRWA